MNKISIIDYGLCNLYNVSNALDYLKAKVEIIEKPEDVTNATHLILPGVGAFKNGMRGLKIRNLIEPIKEHIDKDKPFLGICLGMQMMLSKSYEFGEISGLDIIDGEVVKIPHINNTGEAHKIPHIGWNKIIYKEDKLTNGQNNRSSMYFVHSYKAECKNEESVIAHTLYNDVKITAIIKSKNAYGCQFHPEKSGKHGLHLLNEFIKL
tara:strand:+ start:19629 stop:20252 length:624 start_codon:yes stop_codon:yes gene_type:complete